MRDYTTEQAQIATLFGRAQAGEAASLSRLMGEHEKLVHYIVRRQWRGALTYAEAMQAGRVGLWRAVLGFDVRRGTAFSTYASVAIARHVWRAVRKVERGAEELSWEPQPDPTSDPLTILLGREVQAALHAAVEELPVRQRWVVCAYYGLDGAGGSTLKELGQRLGCSRQAVHSHLWRAIDWLRLRVKDQDMAVLRRGRYSREQLRAERRARLQRRARRRGYG